MKKVLLLALTISLFSCSSDEATALLPLPTPAPEENSIAHFRASLNGQALNYSQTSWTTSSSHQYSYSNGYTNPAGGDYFDKAYYYGCVLTPLTNTDTYPQIGLTFVGMYTTADESEETAAFHQVFSANLPTNFITMDEENDGVKGIYVNYESANGTRYSSLSGNQAGSAINFTSSTSGMEGMLKIQTITGTVNCKLYNESNPSDVIVLTGGQYKVVLREFD